MNRNILVIASFPEKGQIHGEQTVGGASYTKNMLLGMMESAKQQDKELSVTVLAEKLSGQENSYQDEGIQAHRIWKRNNLGSWLTLLHKAVVSPVKNVFIAFELAVFGGTFSLLFLLMLIAFLRLAGKQVTIVCHHVILDLDEVAGHLNTKKGSIINTIGNIFLKAFYFFMITMSHQIVVFDQLLKDKLKRNKNKIIVIPHGVEAVIPKVTQEEARKKLEIANDEFVLVSFGYLAWYKGTDWLVNAVEGLPEKIGDKKIRLIIAGGANPNRLAFDFYRTYIEKLLNLAQKSNGKIHITGYVPQEQIELYYQAADCLVYPYRTAFSASGPLSLAFSYKKPFLLADALSEITKTEDFTKAMDKEGISIEKNSFSLSKDSLQKGLEQLIADKEYKTTLTKLAGDLAHSRSFTSIGKQYLALID